MKKLKKTDRVYYAITVFSTLFFLGFYGYSCLNPRNVDWLLSGGLDISQHYAGWMFFRKNGWMFPVGNFRGLSWPSPMSVIYMDSIPLLAVLFKLFRPILPRQFQYFGWYQLFCFILQGILGVKIAWKLGKNRVAVFLAGAMFVMTPAFLWRVFLHVALSSHWILLLAMAAVLYYEEYFVGRKKRMVMFWAMIGFLCCTIHLYFLPMCFVILLGFLYVDLRYTKRLQVGQWLVMAGFWGGVLIPMFLLGGFIPGMGISDLRFTWKKTFNLNGFFNPQSWSRVMPNLAQHTYGQSEGFAWLGLGVLACLLISFLVCGYRVCTCKGRMWKYLQMPMVQAFLGIFVLSVAASVSPVITLGSRAITIPFPVKLEELWMIFRASGRLVWPAVYCILFGTLFVLMNLQKEKLCIGFLLAALVLQVFDMSEKVWERGRVSRAPEAFVSELQDPGWEIVGSHPDIRNIVYVNVSGLQSCASMAVFADTYDLTLGKFYFARDYEAVTGETAVRALEEKDSRDLFLFDMGRVIDAWNEPDLYYYCMDHKLIGYSRPIEGLEEAILDVWEQEYVYACEVTPASAGAEMIDGFLFIHGGGRMVSQEFTLPEGMYRFTVEGENMKDGRVLVSCGDVESHEMQTITGTIRCEQAQQVTITMENPSDHDMVLYQIRLQPIGIYGK
jgi:hypothetical protein